MNMRVGIEFWGPLTFKETKLQNKPSLTNSSSMARVRIRFMRILLRIRKEFHYFTWII